MASILSLESKITEKAVSTSFYLKDGEGTFSTIENAGRWRYLFKGRKVFLENTVLKLLRLPESQLPKISDVLSFVSFICHDHACALLFNSMQGHHIDSDLKLRTYDKQYIWVRVLGKPIRDDSKNIIGVQGAFQELDSIKSPVLVDGDPFRIPSWSARIPKLTNGVLQKLLPKISSIQRSKIRLFNKKTNLDYSLEALKNPEPRFSAHIIKHHFYPFSIGISLLNL